MNTSKTEGSQEIKLSILRYFESHQRTSTAEFLAAMLGTSLTSTTSAIYELLGDGLVRLAIMRGGLANGERFAITETGEEFLRDNARPKGG